MLKRDELGMAYSNIILACGVVFSVAVFSLLIEVDYYYAVSALFFLGITVTYLVAIKKRVDDRYGHRNDRIFFMRQYRRIILDIVNSCAFTNFSVSVFYIAQGGLDDKPDKSVLMNIIMYSSLVLWFVCTFLYTRFGLQREGQF